MKKSNAGIVCILSNYNSPEMRKVMDFKITTSYPAITFPKEFNVIAPQLNQEIKEYQHLTIPPDLNLHLTGNNKPKIWLKSFKNLIDKRGYLIKEYQKLLTVVFPPISNFPVFTNRSYKGTLLIAMQQLPHWNANTSFVLELFVVKENKRNIPKNEHYSGELGTYLAFKYRDMAKTFDKPQKQGNFYILPFAITNHKFKPQNTITIYFGNFINK